MRILSRRLGWALVEDWDGLGAGDFSRVLVLLHYTSSFWLQGVRNNMSFEVNGHHYMNYFDY